MLRLVVEIRQLLYDRRNERERGSNTHDFAMCQDKESFVKAEEELKKPKAFTDLVREK